MIAPPRAPHPEHATTNRDRKGQCGEETAEVSQDQRELHRGIIATTGAPAETPVPSRSLCFGSDRNRLLALLTLGRCGYQEAAMSTPSWKEAARTPPHDCGDGTIIGAGEFLRMLLSRRALTRCDTTDGRYCGLVDLNTGRQFFIARQAIPNSLTA